MTTSLKDKIYLVALDRDDTIINDDSDGYFGKYVNWKSTMTFCDRVIDALRLLKHENRIKIIVTSNQPGIARLAFDEQRVQEVNEEIASRLELEGIILDKWYFCPYASERHARSWKKRGIPYDSRYIGYSSLRKPHIGMLEQAAKDLQMSLDDFTEIYCIGNKKSDVQTGLNAGGKGILVYHELHEDEYLKVVHMPRKYKGRLFVADNLLEAARIVIADMQNKL